MSDDDFSTFEQRRILNRFERVINSLLRVQRRVRNSIRRLNSSLRGQAREIKWFNRRIEKGVEDYVDDYEELVEESGVSTFTDLLIVFA